MNAAELAALEAARAWTPNTGARKLTDDERAAVHARIDGLAEERLERARAHRDRIAVVARRLGGLVVAGDLSVSDAAVRLRPLIDAPDVPTGAAERAALDAFAEGTTISTDRTVPVDVVVAGTDYETDRLAALLAAAASEARDRLRGRERVEAPQLVRPDPSPRAGWTWARHYRGPASDGPGYFYNGWTYPGLGLVITADAPDVRPAWETYMSLPEGARLRKLGTR